MKRICAARAFSMIRAISALSAILSVLVSVLVLVFIAAMMYAMPAFASHQFSDVQTGGKYHDIFSYLNERGIIGGYSDGTMRPDNPIKRVEVLRVLLDAAEVPLPQVSTDETAGFPDTVAGQWYIKYVKAARERGIVQGYGDGTFRPVNTIKLGEALKMIFLANDIAVPDLAANVELPNDTPATQWFAKYVYLGLQKGIIEEDSAGNVKPGLDLSRAQFSELAYRLRFIQDEGLAVFSSGAAVDDDTAGSVIGVFIENFAFSPATVEIRRGDTVKFVNKDSVPHHVATDPHPIHTQLAGFESIDLQKDGTYEFTFNETGTFTYHCHIHPSMRGTAVVTE